MMYPREVVEQVVTANDIVDVIGTYVQLKRSGSTYKGLCPFHGEKTPSFSVSPSRQTYHCFGCGEGGDVISFLMKYENDSFTEALQKLADRAGITLPEADYSAQEKARSAQRARLLAVNKETATYYYRLLRSAKGRSGMQYLTNRALSAEIMKSFGLGYADGASSDLVAHLREKGYADEDILTSGVAVFDEKRGLHDRFWNRVIFPIMDASNRVIGFGGRVMGDGQPKYLNSPETPVFDKSHSLYGLNLAKRSRSENLILCEGYMDVIAMHQAGFSQAVASLGTAFTDGQAALLRRYGKEVLLAYDSDAAGVKAALRNIEILNRAGITGKVVNLEPYKDPDEFVKGLGAGELQKRLDQAENSFFYQIRQLAKNYTMQDPASRTAFYQELARRLCGFGNEIERDSYIRAMAEQYYIEEGMLRREVERYSRVYGQEERETFPHRDGHSVQAAQDRVPVMARESGMSADSPTAGAARAMDRSGRDPQDPGAAPMRSGGRLSRTQEAEQRDERLLLTWIADDPDLYPQIREVITADDFSDGLVRQAAEQYFAILNREAGDSLAVVSGTGGKVSASPAIVIGLFEDAQDQRFVASLFETRLEGIAPQEKEKALRDILCNVKSAHIRRLSVGMTDSSALGQIIREKKELQTIRSMSLRLSSPGEDSEEGIL